MGCKESRNTCYLIFTVVLVVLRACMTGESRHTLREKHYKWRVKYEFWSPDCVERMVIGINGQYPGPTIRAHVGDTIVVNVENLMPTEGLVIHWHGIRQVGTPWSDGTASVTQCAINPGETYVYKFLADKAGTYFYHGHLGMQRTAGLYGSLIVNSDASEPEPFQYDGELSIIVSDWWHKSIYEQMAGLSSLPFRWVGNPQSLLIQGRGRHKCLGENCSNIPECAPHALPVQHGKTYRLRIASVASLASLNFLIEGHKMTVVEADGSYIEPIQVDNLDINSGETYSVLVRANRDPSKNYSAALNMIGRPPNTPTGLAIFNYLPNPANQIPSSIPPPRPPWNNFEYNKYFVRKIVARRSPSNANAVPPQADKTIFLLNTQNLVEGYLKWAINNVSLALPSTPYLVSMKYKHNNHLKSASGISYERIRHYDITKPPPNTNATVGTPVYNFVLNSTVDMILQNANTLTPGESEIHPWHIHGHSFWVLGYGDGLFDPDKDPLNFNVKNPSLRNTVTLFPYGWTAIRLKADNPGVWMFHCHLEAHLHMGMGIVFAQGVGHVGKLPKSLMGCGFTRSWFP